MNVKKSLLAGAAGAVLLNVLHESARQWIPSAPRVDLIGRQLIAKAFRQPGKKPPTGQAQYLTAMAADVLSNTLYYSVVGRGSRRSAEWRGLILGAVGGIGAVVVPNYLNVSKKAVQRSRATQWMTVAWYTLGGLAAGWVRQRMDD